MNLIKSTGTFSFYTILSRILGYLRDFLIAKPGSGPITDAFFVASEYQIHLEDYFLKEHLILLLFKAIHLNLKNQK